MHDELRYRDVVTAIDTLIKGGVKTELPRWVKWVDYFLTFLYLSLYICFAVYLVNLVF